MYTFCHEIADVFVVEGSDIGRGHTSIIAVSVQRSGRGIRLSATIQHRIDFLVFSSIELRSVVPNVMFNFASPSILVITRSSIQMISVFTQ